MPNIFYNQSIYDSYQDYVLGGFIVEDGDVVDYNTISNAVDKRIEVLIKDFYLRGWSANSSKNLEYTEEDAMTDIAFMITDNLGIMPKGLSMSNLHKTIINSENMMKWLNQEIKSRVSDYMKYEFSNNVTMKGIPSLSESSSYQYDESYSEAESATYETTLEEYIEQLSLIEL